MHDAIPEVASLPAKETVIGFEYQPFASGPRASDAPAAGAVASYLSAKARGALVLPAASRHTPATVAEPLSGPE